MEELFRITRVKVQKLAKYNDGIKYVTTCGILQDKDDIIDRGDNDVCNESDKENSQDRSK